jgi:hypothetical protein
MDFGEVVEHVVQGDSATVFMRDVAARLAHRVQLTTDGYKAYLKAVDS